MRSKSRLIVDQRKGSSGRFFIKEKNTKFIAQYPSRQGKKKSSKTA